MLRGIHLEPIGAEMYAEKTGRKVRRQPFRVHPTHPILAGTVDRQVLTGNDVTSPGVLEIKAPGLRNFMDIKRNGLPPYAILQLQSYLAVYGYTWGSFAVFSAEDWQLINFDVEAHPEVQARIIEQSEQFWRDHVLTRIPPPSSLKPIEDLPVVAGEITYRTDREFAQIAQDFFEARELVGSAEAVKELAASRMKELLGVPGVYEESGISRFYFADRAGRKTFDQKALAAAKPLDAMKVQEILLQEMPHSDALAVSQLLAESARLDLDQYNKLGSGYRELRGFMLTPMSDE